MKRRAEEGGFDSLLDKSRRQPNFKNRMDEATEAGLVAIAIEFPAYAHK